MARSRFNEVEEKDKKPISKVSARNVKKILGFIDRKSVV
jgi:hypothetical protein